jgi:hypothetical protein
MKFNITDIEVGSEEDLNAASLLINALLQKSIKSAEPKASVETTKVEPQKAEPVAKETAEKEEVDVSATLLSVIKATAKDMIKAGKRELLKTCLDEFGAKKVTELKEDQYEGFYSKLTDLWKESDNAK